MLAAHKERVFARRMWLDTFLDHGADQWLADVMSRAFSPHTRHKSSTDFSAEVHSAWASILLSVINVGEMFHWTRSSSEPPTVLEIIVILFNYSPVNEAVGEPVFYGSYGIGNTAPVNLHLCFRLFNVFIFISRFPIIIDDVIFNVSDIWICSNRCPKLYAG